MTDDVEVALRRELSRKFEKLADVLNHKDALHITDVVYGAVFSLYFVIMELIVDRPIYREVIALLDWSMAAYCRARGMAS